MPVPSHQPTLLIITSETSEAERLMAVLRESHLAKQALTVPNAEHLERAIGNHSCDLVLCCAYDRDIDVDAVLATYQRLGADIPLILITDPDSWETDVSRARRAGVRDLVRRGDSEHLCLSAMRELNDLRARRTAKGLNQRLERCDQAALSLADVCGAGVALIQDGLHMQANPAYAGLFGYVSPEDILALPLLDLIAPEDHPGLRDLLKAIDPDNPPLPTTIEATCVRADASRFRALLLFAPSTFEDEPCLRLIAQPLTIPSSSVATKVCFAAGRPGLIPLIEEIERHIDQQRYVSHPFAIFFIHVPKAADLMRDMGLSIGLEVMDEFSESLANLIGKRGILARVGLDGFGLVVPGLDESSAQALAAELSAKARLPLRVPIQENRPPDCKVGYFVVRDRASAPEDILNAAYRLCVGQPPGSDAVSVAASQDQEEAMARKIEFALRNDQLKLSYQPIISLMGDNQENYSVLLRLFDEDENLFEAKEFIRVAVRQGLIEELDRWVMRSAIEVVGQRRRAGHNLSLFVTLAEESFRNPNFVLWICDWLREFDVRGNWLTIQFHEESVIGNLASIGKLIETLRKIKCRVAISHFGTADRPEILLQALSLDFVLFQPELARGLADDPPKQQRLMQLATLAREFNVKSVVTGVEDARTLTVLWTAGVDYVQGNFLQRPSPTIEIQT
ncbi:EAL domain-containing protein [Caldichromatium japonicum]|uniref:EAL domain-containing protein n=1 Tax=Caldichromatium japonicum TaxID=2699430 RepID=A0A6G7VE96_9GAMM|nr:EAL domain-containing protein [Caldichromatium japonicum]QIK38294.1 EAL domain-containing protein [Caldichromatium japonicum]